jgi:predicted nucleotidyltransferase
MDYIELLRTKLKEIANIEFAYLFGSYANNTYSVDSDIDLALYLKDTSFDNILQINYILSKELKTDLDIIVLNDIKNIFLLDDILTNGIILKDNEKRVDFELIKEHQILDYKAFRKLIDAA